MNKVIDVNKEPNTLINKKLKEVTVEEGRQIAAKLFQILNERGDGIGLAANQVGIDAQVAVVNVREPLVLINPKIVKKETEIDYFEGCLSYPGKGIHTRRYETVEVKTEQEEGMWVFSGADTGDPLDNRDLRLLEAVCIQHEIDHLNGVTIMDRKIDTTYRRTEKKIGRNQLVTLKKGEAVKVIKYKKAQGLLEQGWTMSA